jgi:hypothetical protein
VIRVGTDEVYITPDGRVQPASLAVIWAVNRECKARGIEPIFGEPRLDVEQDGAITREVYDHADVVHINGARARELDPTTRIVPKTDLARDIFDKVWAEMRDRVALVQHAHAIPGVDPDALQSWREQRRGVTA